MGQRELARASGVAASVISRVERGLQADLKVSVLVALSDALRVPVGELLLTAQRPVPAELSQELAAVVAVLARRPEEQQQLGAGVVLAASLIRAVVGLPCRTSY